MVSKRHVAYLCILSLSLCGLVFWLYNDNPKPKVKIVSYDERYFDPLVKIMTDNHFWISERREFSPHRVLRWRAPQDDPDRKGEASIDVALLDDVPAGFIAYYMKSKMNGYIWLLAVDETYRGQGIAQKLMEHGLEALKKQHAKFISISVRTINTPAINLYKKLGFKEEWRDDERGIMQLIKSP